MKSVVMAGGEGTRLRPLTSLRPKPMVPIVNQPVMEHIIGLLKHHGIEDIIATLAFMPRVIEDYFGGGEEWGVRIEYAVEESPLGTAGSIKNAEELLDKNEPFLVISGDAITDIDLTELVRFHKECGGAVTIALKRVDDPLDFGVVITGEDGHIQRFLEKPSWGQVFSDTINTGIYVIEPWVLDYIPLGQPSDFSADIFPALMQDGHALYGKVMDGYWCDVGSRETYMTSHRDILEGRGQIFVPGVVAREGLWVAETAKVDEGVELGKYVVIGQNVRVRSGAVIEDHTVIGDNCVIGSGARIGHSILWNDTFVADNASVYGAILGHHVDVREQARVDVGAVIGDESVVGKGAHVGANVQVFPYKRIDASALVRKSIIWESTGGRSLFGEARIEGLVGVDITPELALKAAEAWGSLMPKGGHVVISRDTTRAARMVKRAMIAGLNATGMNVRDLRVASPTLCRFTTQKSQCVGGIHVSGSVRNPQSLDIAFFDSSGLDISPWSQKKIERLFFREEFRRAFFDEIGEITYPARPVELYVAGLRDAVEAAGLKGGPAKIVADMAGSPASFTLPEIARSWNINLVALNIAVDAEGSNIPAPRASDEGLVDMQRAIHLFGADLGVFFDWGAERVRLVTNTGRVLDTDTALHAMVELWCRTCPTEGAIAVPLTASSVVDRIAEKYGHAVIRPGHSRRALAAAVVAGDAVLAGGTGGGFIFGNFFPSYDAVLTIGMLIGMLGKVGISLSALVKDLPEFHKREGTIACPADRKGAVMRVLSDLAAATGSTSVEGIRVPYDDGWVLALPHATDPVVTVWVEGPTDEVADERLREWCSIVQHAVAEG